MVVLRQNMSHRYDGSQLPYSFILYTPTLRQLMSKVYLEDVTNFLFGSYDYAHL